MTTSWLAETAAKQRASLPSYQQTFHKLLNETGYRFEGKVPIDNYIVDFVCHDLKLIIEVKVPKHSNNDIRVKINSKTSALRSMGYRVFWPEDLRLKSNPWAVVCNIMQQYWHSERLANNPKRLPHVQYDPRW